MGTIAARDCIRVIELTEQVAAAVQALLFRREEKGFTSKATAAQPCEEVLQYYKPLEEDRPLDKDLLESISRIRTHKIY
jgi:histidine ammonia-lyase